MSIDNFILTKYNINFSRGRYAKKADEWMSQRIKVFRKYTLPSVAAQSYKGFLWMIFMDIKSKNAWKDELLELVTPYNFCRIHFTDQDRLVEYARSVVRENRKNECVVTTRLDNDDAIRNSFLKLTNFTAEHYVVDPSLAWDSFNINFDWGFVYDIRRKDVRFSKQSSNPFISRVETTDKINTVWGYRHTEAHLHKRKVSVGDSDCPMWVQVIHGLNVSNGLQGSSYDDHNEGAFDRKFEDYYEENFR